MKKLQVTITVLDGEKLLFDKTDMVSVERLKDFVYIEGFIASFRGRKTKQIAGTEIGAVVKALLDETQL